MPLYGTEDERHGLRNRLADGFENGGLFPGRDAEGYGDEFPRFLPGVQVFCPEMRFLAGVLIAGVHTGGQKVIGRRKMRVGSRGVEQGEVFRMAICIP
jgi:hypothetical protein